MNPIWRIELLGGLRGHCETGAEFAPGVSRVGALLSCLVLAPDRFLNRDLLATLLWPEADTAAGRTRLRQELSVLRRHLEPDGARVGSVLLRVRDRIALLPGAIVTDVKQFLAAFAAANSTHDIEERDRLLTEVAALWHGELLPGYDYEGLELERAHLARCYETALREMANLRQARGDFHGAEICLRSLIAQNPILKRPIPTLCASMHVRGR